MDHGQVHLRPGVTAGIERHVPQRLDGRFLFFFFFLLELHVPSPLVPPGGGQAGPRDVVLRPPGVVEAAAEVGATSGAFGRRELPDVASYTTDTRAISNFTKITSPTHSFWALASSSGSAGWPSPRSARPAAQGDRSGSDAAAVAGRSNHYRRLRRHRRREEGGGQCGTPRRSQPGEAKIYGVGYKPTCVGHQNKQKDGLIRYEYYLSSGTGLV